MRKFGIVLICIIFFLLIGPVILAFNFQNIILSSPQNIKKVLVDINAYERITKINAHDLIELIQPENRDEQSQIPEETLQKMINAVTPKIAQNLVEQSLDSYYSATKTGRSEISIDLREIKSATISSQQVELQTQLSQAIPDTYVINNPSKQISPYLKYFSGAVKYSGLVIIFVLAVIAIFLGNGVKGKFATTATLSLLSAISLFSIFCLSSYIPFSKISSGNNNAISVEAFSILRDFLEGIWKLISSIIFRQAVVSTILAAILYILATIIPKRPAKSEYKLPTNMSNVPPRPQPSDKI